MANLTYALIEVISGIVGLAAFYGGVAVATNRGFGVWPSVAAGIGAVILFGLILPIFGIHLHSPDLD